MSDHNFEKQVRQKLDDLRLTPSPQAWGNIEREIKLHRRRRAPLLWLGLVILGLGAGGYFILNNSAVVSDKQLAQSDVSTQTQHQSKSVISEQPETTASNESPRSTEPQASPKQSPPRVATPQSAQTDDVNKTSNRSETLREKPANAASAPNQIKEPSVALIVDGDKNTSNNTFPRAQLEGRELNTQAPQESAEMTSSTKSVNYYTTIPSIQHQAVAKPLRASAFNLNPPATLTHSPAEVAAPPLLQKPKKWSFGISVFAGASGMNDNLLPDLKKKSSVSALAQNAVFAAAPHTPFKVAPDFAYSAGLVVKYELSKRFQISSGINYQQLNTRFKLGNRVYGYQAVNAAPFVAPAPYVRNYFTLERHEAQNLKNTYHFAELPVTLHTRLTNSRKLPIYWNFGLSWSQLVSSNSMQFDTNTGVYYSNKKSLRKTQFGLNTGFDVVAFSRSKMPLWVGPAVRYNIKPVASNGYASEKYFLSGGVNVKLFIR